MKEPSKNPVSRRDLFGLPLSTRTRNRPTRIEAYKNIGLQEIRRSGRQGRSSRVRALRGFCLGQEGNLQSQNAIRQVGCFGRVRSRAGSVAGRYGSARETVRRKRSASRRFGPKKKTVNVKMEPVGCGETQRFRLLGVRVQGGQRGRMQEGQASKCAH